MGRGRKILELDGEVGKASVGKEEGSGGEKKRGGEVGKATWGRVKLLLLKLHHRITILW